MKVGFTGTRNGMTNQQFAFILKAIKEIKPNEAHHGACIGADKHFHDIAISQMIPVVIHPGVNKQGVCYSRASCPNAKEVKNEKFFLDRDKDIVNEVDLLIATPKNHKEELRSGTWATVRYARKKNKHLLIVYPDGTYEAN